MQTPAFSGQDLWPLYRQLRAYALGLTRDVPTAEDLAQETLRKLWEDRSSFRPGTSLRSWAFCILRNEYYSLCRKTKVRIQWRSQEENARISEFSYIEPPQYHYTLLCEVLDCWDQLAPDGRAALELVAFRELTFSETADELEIPLGSVKSRLFRVREDLRARFDA